LLSANLGKQVQLCAAVISVDPSLGAQGDDRLRAALGTVHRRIAVTAWLWASWRNRRVLDARTLGLTNLVKSRAHEVGRVAATTVLHVSAHHVAASVEHAVRFVFLAIVGTDHTDRVVVRGIGIARVVDDDAVRRKTIVVVGAAAGLTRINRLLDPGPTDLGGLARLFTAGAKLACEFGAGFGAFIGLRPTLAIARGDAPGRKIGTVTDGRTHLVVVGTLGIGPIPDTADLVGGAAWGAYHPLSVFASAPIRGSTHAAAGLTGVLLRVLIRASVDARLGHTSDLFETTVGVVTGSFAPLNGRFKLHSAFF